MSLPRRTPALVAHEDDRGACLRVEVDEQHSLTPRHGQAVGEHHRQCGLTHAAPTIGDGDELRH